MSQNEKRLRELYQERKQQIKTPDSIRIAAFEQVKQKQTKETTVWLVFGKQVNFAAACLGLLALGLLITQSLNITQRPTTAQNIIEIKRHQELLEIPDHDLNQKYVNAQNSLKQSQLTMAVHHKRVALIAKVGNSWELKMCDNRSVKISPHLLTELAANNSLAQGVTQGDYVEIAFSEAGLIIGIGKPLSSLTC